MTGIEIAGLVLGSLPVLITAFEHYGDAMGKVKAFVKFESGMRLLALEVGTEQIIYLNNLELLLTGAVRSDVQAVLLSNPGGHLWRDLAVKDALRARLGHAYETYCNHMTMMGDLVGEMKSKLGLKDGQPPFRDPSMLRHEYKRLKFTIQKSAYANALTELRNHNRALKELTRQSSLRSALQLGCRTHVINLRLERRYSQSSVDGAALYGKGPFRIMVSDHENPNTSTPDQAVWHEANICLIEERPRFMPSKVIDNQFGRPKPRRKKGDYTGRQFTRRDRMHVAVDLAASMIQLSNTPWLAKEWRRDDILFVQRPGEPIFEHPFVCGDFHKAPAGKERQGGHVECSFIRNPILFNLGILLIEIWYGKPIEAFRIPEDLKGGTDAGIVWHTATRLVREELWNEAGQRYSHAVRRFLQCEFDGPEMSLENEDFQAEVYGKVVVKLEEELQHFVGMK
ncbi:hypothetical protein CC80DRAFT_454428 [Byssothecium circinans]|uniref:DUF7580 domain-containing protein n=1 Tax=Byssothecium circinans TaxID=147558 RepID=A0A6A5TED8_9PLEO|nr:hypothetical protein CC80DRAFT_454428 [Byssothecium circinans]